MANRRQFIQSSLAFSALSFTDLAIAELTPLKNVVLAANTADFHLQDFVFDKRYEFARDLSLKVAQHGIPLAEMSGDLTELWYHRYSRQWKQAPMTLAGVTANDGLFVLETLAADHGMRVVHKDALEIPAFYKNDPDETLYSWIIAPRTT